MTPIDREVLKAGERFLSGPCRSIGFYPELALRFETDTLFVGSAWRVRRERNVIASSETDQERATEFVLGSSVKSLTSKGPYNDLVLVFDNETVLETSDDGHEYERWRIAGPRPEELIVGGPGELWSSFGFDPKEQV